MKFLRDACKVAVGANGTLALLASMAGPKFEPLLTIAVASLLLCAWGAWGKESQE